MRGQSLFEVIFAIAIAALILVGVVSIAANSVRNASFARNQALATRHVQGASEWLRAERDDDWTAFSSRALASPGRIWCLSSFSWPFSFGPCGPSIGGSIFNREVTLILEAVDIVRAEIVVDWTDTQGLHDARSIARFTDWQGGKVAACFFNNPQPPGSTSSLCAPPSSGSPSSSCGSMGGATCCRYECVGGYPHWCERTGGSPGSCNGFMDCGLEC